MLLRIEGLEYLPYEILGLSHEILPAEAEPSGAGTFQDPYQMNSVSKWYGAARKADFIGKHAFYKVGGRLLHRRVNRVEGKFDHYITDCGAFNESNQRILAEAFANKTKHAKIRPGAPREEFNRDERWYQAAPDAQFVPLGPSYVDLLERMQHDGDTRASEELAAELRGILGGTVENAPAAMAIIATGWFLSEVNRYNRAMICGLALLDLIERRKNSEKELQGATPYRFQDAVYQDAKVKWNLSHPMSGQGTVGTADASNKVVPTLASYVQSGASFAKQPAVGALSKLQEKETRILIRWVAWYLKDRHGAAEIVLGEGGADRVKVAAKRPAEKGRWDAEIRNAFTNRVQNLNCLLV